MPGYKLKPNEISEFSRQLAGMLKSGITVIRAVGILKSRDFKPVLLGVYGKLHKDVSSGSSLSEAMRLQKPAFPELLINMYASGETSGQLGRAASKMAAHYEKEYRLNNKIRSAMTYPVVLSAVTGTAAMVIFTLILPETFSLFEDMPLPLITRVMFALSRFFRSYWLRTIAGVLIITAFVKYLSGIYKVSLWYDKKKLKFILFGRLLKTIYTARFARTLSSLYSGGVSIIDSLEISASVIGNKFIREQLNGLIENVRNGELLSEAAGKISGFDKKLAAYVLIGEESGNLDGMLISAAESLDYEAETAAEGMTRLLEPLLIVSMAAIICFIMLSVMLPVFDLYNNIAQ
ncbi:MAG: type II secretion system F family protein [Oscillospiraceae bacterium]|nr:type II secretion system F family protein [Oscillospiraceae bacterium]